LGDAPARDIEDPMRNALRPVTRATAAISDRTLPEE
jgi:hypothetical protein